MGDVGRAYWGHERETETELLARVRQGDPDAFSELAERNEAPALAVARAIVDPATAEDVVADCFERLLILLRRGDGPDGALRPYFLQMVRRRAIDYWRRQSEVPAGEVPDTAPAEADDFDPTVVRTAFAALPERWQTALWLSIVENRSHAEIGKELAVAENAASQLLHRAREGLRQSYLDAQIGGDAECLALQGLLGKYVRGRCGRRDTARVEEHLEQCPGCRHAVSQTRKLNDRLPTVLVVSLIGGAGLALLRPGAKAWAAEVGAGPAHAVTGARWGRTPRYLMSAAAGVALSVGLVLALPGARMGNLAVPVFSTVPTASGGSTTPALPSASAALPSEAGVQLPAVERPVKPEPPAPSRAPVSVPSTTRPPTLGGRPSCDPTAQCGGEAGPTVGAPAPDPPPTPSLTPPEGSAEPSSEPAA